MKDRNLDVLLFVMKVFKVTIIYFMIYPHVYPYFMISSCLYNLLFCRRQNDSYRKSSRDSRLKDLLDVFSFEQNHRSHIFIIIQGSQSSPFVVVIQPRRSCTSDIVEPLFVVSVMLKRLLRAFEICKYQYCDVWMN